MPSFSNNDRDRLREIKSFPSLVKYLRDELAWPIESDDFEEISFDYTPQELGIDASSAAKIQEIKQLRPLSTGQPWGIFFVKFEPKKLPVVVLRKILARLVVKKPGRDPADRQVWDLHDLLFISNYGVDDDRHITFAHFTQDEHNADLPELKILGWDEKDTNLHFDQAISLLKSHLIWNDGEAVDDWRHRWSAAFRLRPRQVINTSKELAVRLAALARDIRAKCIHSMSYETDQGPLKSLMAGFKQALIHDLDETKFADLYAQTISYGLLSMAIRRTVPGEGHAIVVDNLTDLVNSGNPFLKDLLTQFLNVGGRRWNDDAGRLIGIDFDELGINDVVDTLRQANMEAVLADFGNRTPQEDPVIHFYELFLKEYDAELRMQRGVFYTPRPVVSYIVRSVHELLQTEFGLPDGLADTATWADMLLKHKDLKLPEIELVDPSTRNVSKQPIDPKTPFVQILDPATGTATFLVEVIDIIHKTMVEKWKKENVPDLWIGQKWNDYVPKHLLPRLYGYELMMAPYAIAHMKIGLKLFETGYKFTSGERARIYLTNALEPPQDFSDTFEQMAPALAHEANAVNDVKRFSRFTVVVGNPPYSNYSANLSQEARQIVDRYRTFKGTLIRERNQLQFERNIQDDFVKFVSVAQDIILTAGVGVLSYITNGTMLASASLRGMRECIARDFNGIFELNLHGGGNEIIVGVEDDENVFDIVQSVAVHAYVRSKPAGSPSLHYADLLGRRSSKYDTLGSQSVASIGWAVIQPDVDNFSFMPQDQFGGEANRRLDSAFVKFGAGIKTSRDAVVIGFDEATLLEQVREFNASLVKDIKPSDYIQLLLYRPFDTRKIFYHEEAIASRSFPTMTHIISGPNIGFICSSTWTTPDRFSVGISRLMVEMKTGTHDRGTTFFPLYRYESYFGGRIRRVHNLTPAFVVEWCHATGTELTAAGRGDDERTSGPEDVFFWLYGLFYSPEYRRRYRAALAQRFPIILLPEHPTLLRSLSLIGEELAGLHLLESNLLNRRLTQYTGEPNPEVVKISWSENTVWIDKDKTVGFKGVALQLWEFRFGGYQVCEKWLKDRKGRTLDNDDVEHYQKIIVAISETIRLMKEIDEVIEKHGGWPGAFVTSPASGASSSSETPKSAMLTETVTPRPQRIEQPPDLTDEDEKILDAIWDKVGAESTATGEKASSPKNIDRPLPIDQTERVDVMAVVRDLFSDGQSRDREQAMRDVSDAMGYERLGSKIRDTLDDDLRTAVRRGILSNDQTRGLTLQSRGIGDYTRDQLIDMLLAAIGNVWRERDEAIRLAARHIGFRRTGSAITEAFKSTINAAIRRGLIEAEGTRIRKLK